MINKTRTLVAAMIATAFFSAPAHAMEKYDILMGGYYNGPSIAGALGINNVFTSVPVGFEIGLGYSWTPAGNGTLARRRFSSIKIPAAMKMPKVPAAFWISNMNVTYPLEPILRTGEVLRIRRPAHRSL